MAVPAWAAGPGQALSEAQAKYAAGDKLGALDQAREALLAIWTEAPLTARRATFVTEPPQGYGMYTPATKPVFDTVDPIHVYLEPVGGAVRREGGLFKMSLAADFAVKDGKGKVLGGQENIQGLQTTTRTFSSEVMMTLTFNLKGLPSGQYTLVVTLRDLFSDKKTAVELPFAVQ
jgi:hypothetical protein